MKAKTIILILFILCSCNKVPEFEKVTDEEIYAILNTVLRNDNEKFIGLISNFKQKIRISQYLDISELDTLNNDKPTPPGENCSIHLNDLLKSKYLDSNLFTNQDIKYLVYQTKVTNKLLISKTHLDSNLEIELIDRNNFNKQFVQLSKPIFSLSKNYAYLIFQVLYPEIKEGQSVVVYLSKRENTWYIVGEKILCTS